MTPFDLGDSERTRPSSATPPCRLCEEAALPRYGGFCFRHAFVSPSAGAARAAVARR